MRGKSLPAGTLSGALTKPISALSVRVRIALIALIPVAGFLANGMAFIAGERQVESAFEQVAAAGTLENASRDFKESLSRMRATAADFSREPEPGQVRSFAESHALAMRSLDVIQHHSNADATKLLPHIRSIIDNIKLTFDGMVAAQQNLGFEDAQGIRDRLRRAVENAENAIADLSWLPKADAQNLSISLLSMRRAQTEFMHRRNIGARGAFQEEFKNFNASFDKAVGADIMKQQLREAVQSYADAFRDWVADSLTVDSNLTLIRSDVQEITPLADRMIRTAEARENAASASLSGSQAQTRNIIIGVGCAAIVIGLLFSWLIGRSITAPMRGLVRVMQRLAQGDTEAKIPATDLKDDIGEMARSVIVFRDSMIERERLSGEQKDQGRARERRAESIASTIRGFERSVDLMLGKLRDASQRLEATSGRLNGAADNMTEEAHHAERRVGAASENVTAAAGSVEELAASIGEIAAQVAQSTEVARRAVAEGHRTNATMTELGNAATRIGEVVNLIQEIAGQTNLLALNATIEAARAGDAGRGFAVVASEVKSLANQTAKATEDIAGQIGAIQTSAADAAEAIMQVNTIIEDMAAIAASVATAVEEQTSAVGAISQGVAQASAEAQSGASAMSRVSAATGEARTTAADVKTLADALSAEAEGLETEVRRFLTDVQAA